MTDSVGLNVGRCLSMDRTMGLNGEVSGYGTEGA